MKKKLNKIINLIISKSAETHDLGLLSGKTGIILFLYHYSKYSENKLYADFAGLLIDDIFDDINNKMTISFDNGLSGVGWGIEYALKNNFVEGDSYEILEDIDKQIMSRDIKRIEDETLESGLEGLFHYILYHLPENNTMQCPFDDIYLSDLDIVAQKKNENCKNEELQVLLAIYINWRNGKKMKYSPDKLMKRFLSFEIDDEDETKNDISLGLCKGYAGIGLQIMKTY